MTKKCVVITTINNPTKTIDDFNDLDYDVIVVGDIKTPNTFAHKKCVFLDINKQNELFPKLSKLLSVNHYCRKNIGYLYAIKQGYNIIVDIDDDTFPYPNYNSHIKSSNIITAPSFPNMYSLYTDTHIWPRGFPLDLINKKENIVVGETKNDDLVYVWQGLINDDPDVDAIYRLTSPSYSLTKPFKFNNVDSTYIVNKNVLIQGNSQNTIWMKKNIFYYMYIPSTVSFRFCDILRAYILQYGIWANGGFMGVSGVTAYQERNKHNLLKDFEQEITTYTQIYKVIDVLNKTKLTGTIDDLKNIYVGLFAESIVDKKEIDIIDLWIEEYKKYMG